ncbi:Aspartic proteinase nepenthesin-2 [Acorus gramineus]|uniref:Aspartic proteinase nepenthesin-2 n=1 Tax=Acorus gramineus TaxID=55184 RepID=A0AAV9AAN2_ACOGR|nr:Aspartic proteinase nepenthesin-2 [Acorus gramineus]KAK1261233.1 Aspartic proteinase nepenthesin-2 [Acorus gramineus]
MAVLLFLLFLLNSSSSMASSLSFSAEVIPWDSPKSPFYNPNATYALITSKPKAALISPNWGKYLMRLTVGVPAQKMTALIDTGSHITWFQCLDCLHCYTQNLPRFDPENSNTYETIDCDTDICNKINGHECDDNDLCMYNINYGDRSFSIGTMSKDQFGVESKGGNHMTLPMVAFGCSLYANGTFDEEETGTIGLDMAPISLISQLGDYIHWIFSHCLGRYDDDNSWGRIFFGDGATLLGTPTPILKPKSAPHPFYYVNLIDISVDYQRLNILPDRFLARPNGRGGLIMDTGTPLTYLFKDVYNELVLKLTEKVTLSRKQQKSDSLCYVGEKQDLEDEESVPVVTLHFEGGLNVDLQPWNTFHYWDVGKVCLAIKPVSNSEMSIIGALAQQNMHVGYDLKMKEIYLSPADCTLF